MSDKQNANSILKTNITKLKGQKSFTLQVCNPVERKYIPPFTFHKTTFTSNKLKL